MVNEEGGIDPEQFRMEAMFDRMDAIGKAMLGLTIQCAQCHNHKFDPLTQEEYYRLFAFLNNAHEAQRRGLHAGRADEARRDLREHARDRRRSCKQRQPDWRERMAQWEDSASSGISRSGSWCGRRSTTSRPAAQKYLPQPDGSFLARATRRPAHRVKMTVQTDLQNITAFRLELLTDPNLPLRRPGPVGERDLRADRVRSGSRAGGRAEKHKKVKIAKATADIVAAGDAAADDDDARRKRTTGPIEFAIDGKDETAWGIDAGPGLRNQPHKAVFDAARADLESGRDAAHVLSEPEARRSGTR